MADSSNSMPTRASAAISFKAAANPPRVRVAQAVNCSVGGEHGLDQPGQRSAIALQIALKSQSFAHGHNGHAVPAKIAA